MHHGLIVQLMRKISPVCQFDIGYLKVTRRQTTLPARKGAFVYREIAAPSRFFTSFYFSLFPQQRVFFPPLSFNQPFTPATNLAANCNLASLSFRCLQNLGVNSNQCFTRHRYCTADMSENSIVGLFYN